jgi:hypothetical protein
MVLLRLSALVLITTLADMSYAQDTKRCACCDEKHKQFNFWIGDWKVLNPEGKLAGENKIVVVQDSCVIQENWTSANSSFRGTSYNFVNVHSGKWQQLWIDNQGGNLQLEGGLVNGEMVLMSEEKLNQKGEKQIDRIKWTPQKDGTVRQLWEVSTNGGNKWSVVFDGLYKKE